MSNVATAGCYLAFSLIAFAAQADELKIEGVGISRDISCSSSDVGIYGAENIIKVTGACGRITIHGARHQVTFEQAAEVSISGAENKVTGGVAEKLSVETAKNAVSATLKRDSEEAELEISGAENNVTVQLESPTELEVQGVRNTVRWSKADGVADPRTSIAGAVNDVAKAD